jgi:hypothetical protein
VTDTDPATLSPGQQRDLARDMLLGQHSVSYTAEYTGLKEAQVKALAEGLRKEKRISKVRL